MVRFSLRLGLRQFGVFRESLQEMNDSQFNAPDAGFEDCSIYSFFNCHFKSFSHLNFQQFRE